MAHSENKVERGLLLRSDDACKKVSELYLDAITKNDIDRRVKQPERRSSIVKGGETTKKRR